MPDPRTSRSRDDRFGDGQEVRELTDVVLSMQRRGSARLALLRECCAYKHTLELSERRKSADGHVTDLSRKSNY